MITGKNTGNIHNNKYEYTIAKTYFEHKIYKLKHSGYWENIIQGCMPDMFMPRKNITGYV